MLPSLHAPDGVIVTPNNVGGMSAGFGPGGASANVTYGAMFDGKTSVAELFRTFVSQLGNDGWRQDGSGESHDGAFGAFTRDFNGQTWKSYILVFSADKPQQFRGFLIASGEPLTKPLAPPPPQMPRIPTAITKSDKPVVLELMRRIVSATGGDRSSAVFIRKAPPDLPKAVPLPKGTLVGSTVVFNELGSPGDDTLYYDLTRTNLDDYQRALRRTGWNSKATFVRPSGFVSAPDTEPIGFCKQGEPTLVVSAEPDSNAVSIMVSRGAVLGGCQTMPTPSSEVSQLPKLVTPGARASHLWTAPGGSCPPARARACFGRFCARSGDSDGFVPLAFATTITSRRV